MTLTKSKSYYGSNGTVNSEKEAFCLFALNSLLKNEKEMVEKYLNVAVKQVTGCYKNEIEPSYLVVLPVDGSVDLVQLMSDIIDLCSRNGQESVKIVNSERDAVLSYMDDGRLEFLGKFQQSNPAEAIALGNWTLDGSNFWCVV